MSQYRRYLPEPFWPVRLSFGEAQAGEVQVYHHRRSASLGFGQVRGVPSDLILSADLVATWEYSITSTTGLYSVRACQLSQGKSSVDYTG